MLEKTIKTLAWNKYETRRQHFDGSFVHCNLVREGREQKVSIVGRNLKLVDAADSLFCLCAVPESVYRGGPRMLDIVPGHTIRHCHSLSLRFRCLSFESVGELLVKASYKDMVVQSTTFLDRMLVDRLPPPPVEAPPAVTTTLASRPVPSERGKRAVENKANIQNIGKTKRTKVLQDNGAELLGNNWFDRDLGMCKAVGLDVWEGHNVVTYSHNVAGTATTSFSSVAEVREWCCIE